MGKGYVYCFHNISHPSNYYKVGMTLRTPEQRLKEANSSTWSPTPNSTPFTIVTSKCVKDARNAEKFLHHYLSIHGKRVSNQREFFEVSLEIIYQAFSLVEEYSDNVHNYIDFTPSTDVYIPIPVQNPTMISNNSQSIRTKQLVIIALCTMLILFLIILFIFIL